MFRKRLPEGEGAETRPEVDWIPNDPPDRPADRSHRKDTTMRHPNRLVAALAAGALALPLLLSACSTSPTADAAPESGTAAAAAAAWGACMRENGVDIVDPTAEEFASGAFSFPSDIDSTTVDRATAACSDGGPQTSDDRRAESAQNNRDFVDCMAEAGIDGFVLQQDDLVVDFSQVDQTAPAFERANAECGAAAGFETQGQ